MTPSQRDLKDLFLEALDRAEGSERDAYLDDACRGDASLLAQVEELLEAHRCARGSSSRPTSPRPGSERIRASPLVKPPP